MEIASFVGIYGELPNLKKIIQRLFTQKFLTINRTQSQYIE
jgi:hypothetical protein